jgi:hypothetical protein
VVCVMWLGCTVGGGGYYRLFWGAAVAALVRIALRKFSSPSDMMGGG